MATAKFRDPEPLTVHIVAMRRRYLRSVLNIENQVYPRPWTMSLFLSELGLRGTRAYFVAKVGRDVVGYAGLMVTVDEGHVTTIRTGEARSWRNTIEPSTISVTKNAPAIGALYAAVIPAAAPHATSRRRRGRCRGDRTRRSRRTPLPRARRAPPDRFPWEDRRPLGL